MAGVVVSSRCVVLVASVPSEVVTLETVVDSGLCSVVLASTVVCAVSEVVRSGSLVVVGPNVQPPSATRTQVC